MVPRGARLFSHGGAISIFVCKFSLVVVEPVFSRDAAVNRGCESYLMTRQLQILWHRWFLNLNIILFLLRKEKENAQYSLHCVVHLGIDRVGTIYVLYIR